MSTFRDLPSIDSLLERPAIAALVEQYGRLLVVAALRRATARARVELTNGIGTPSLDRQHLSSRFEREALADVAALVTPRLQRVINATGVILHTNLGRAPWPEEAIARAGHMAGGSANLEYDLARGARGHRHEHAVTLLHALTGAESAAVVNNNAAAVWLALAALADGREVLVSRGELVEIGGGFRVPDILARSGAILREVGTTNRTRTSDYAAAVTPRTAAILRVHPSNFRMEGFTERPGLSDLTALAHRFSLPVLEDLGSGWLGTPAPPAQLAVEPSVRASLEAGVDLVTFSGDKLLGGPQCGILAGREDLVEAVRQHPLMRVVRADKWVYAALEATLALWAQPSQRARIPVYRMLTLTPEAIEARATAIAAALGPSSGLTIRFVDGQSTIGGGSSPGTTLPSRLLALKHVALSANDLEARLRHGSPPIIARIQHDDLLIDLRTVSPGDDEAIVEGLRVALGRSSPTGER